MDILLNTVIEQIENKDLLFLNDYTEQMRKDTFSWNDNDEDSPPDVNEMENRVNTLCKALSTRLGRGVYEGNMLHMYDVCFAKRFIILKKVVSNELSTVEKQKYYYNTVIGSDAVEVEGDSEYLTVVKRNLSRIVYYILQNVDKEYSVSPLTDNNGETIAYSELVNLYGDNLRMIAESISTDLKLNSFAEV